MKRFIINRIFEFTRSARNATARTAITKRRAKNYVAKYHPTKVLQRHATCTKKTNQQRVVEVTILTEPFKGEDVLISRIPMIPTDMPFQFKRLQFQI